jgi:5'-nucleotidase
MRTAPFAAVLALLAGSASAETRLHVLHVNDFHSRIEPVNRFDATCDAAADAAGECFGGAARLAAKVAELRAAAAAAGEPVLVLDAGDQYQGSLLYAVWKGAAEAEMMQAIGFDAMALGNHEFDDGPAGLTVLLDRVGFPVLAGNLDVSAEPLLAGRIADRVVLEPGGLRVGIVAALTPDTAEIASPGPNLRFTDPVASLAEDVAALQAGGVGIILALTHLGLARDLEVAAAVPGIDAIIGGHSHTYLSASDPARAGAYPLWADGPGGALVPVVQAGAHGRYLGHLVLTFDGDGTLLHAEGDTIPLDASVTPDQVIAARVAELVAPVEALKAEVVGEAEAAIDGSRELCRSAECPMGNLVAGAMLERVRGQGIEVAIMNGGGLRASIDEGPITRGEVLTVLPFQNTLATFRVSGAGLRAALENGVSRVEEGAGRFPQVAGLRFVWDPSAPPGARVRSVEVASAGGWAPLDDARLYGVVSNNFLRQGGDGYAMFRDAADAYDYGPGLEQVVVDHIAAMGGRVAPATDGRIARVE